jgi:hypothetical protein
MSEYGAAVKWQWQGKTDGLGEKPVPVSLCPPQIPHGLPWTQTRASAVRRWRLTAWASQPLLRYLTALLLENIRFNIYWNSHAFHQGLKSWTRLVLDLRLFIKLNSCSQRWSLPNTDDTVLRGSHKTYRRAAGWKPLSYSKLRTWFDGFSEP